MLIGIIFDISNHKAKNIVFFYNFIILFLIVSLRYGIGPDYFNYEYIFSQAKDIFHIDYSYFKNQDNNLEYGYLFLESIVKTFTNEFPLFIIVYNLILFLFLYLGIKKFPNRNIQIFVFFTLIHIYYISGHRQAMAMAIIYYNVSNLLDRKLIKFISFTFVASLFHTISLVFMFVYLLSFYRFRRKHWVVIILLSILISYTNIIDYYIDFAYFNYKEYSYIFQRIYHYYFEHHNIEPVNPFNYIKVLFLGLVAYLSYNRVHRMISICLFLHVALFMIFSNAGGLAFRIADLFLIVSLCYSAMIIYNSIGFSKIVYATIIVFYCSVSFLRIIYVHVFFNIDTFLPYKTIFM